MHDSIPVFDDLGNLVATISPAESLWRGAGLSFLTGDSDFVQVGLWTHPKDTHLNAHIHNLFDRSAMRTQEVVYVVAGAIRVHLYDELGSPLEDHDVVAGGLIVCFAGGHGYTILEEGTRVLEVKNGPYHGPELDRRRLY